MNLTAALETIGVKRQVGPPKARAILVEACSTGKVRSRYLVGINDDGLIWRPLSPSVWKGGQDEFISWWDGTLRSSGPNFIGVTEVQIDDSDLIAWLARSRRGPKEGQLARYREPDKALFPELKRIMKERQMSATAAALELAEAGKVAGRGGPLSRAKKLVALYRTEIR